MSSLTPSHIDFSLNNSVVLESVYSKYFFFHKGMIFVFNYSIRFCLVEVFFFISNDKGGFFGLLLMSLF